MAYVYDYGKDTDIFVTTENLTDSISIQPDNEIKNVFKVSGGDDVITSAVQALNMGSSKLMMFSEDTKEEMSEELRKKFDDYIADQSSISSTYQTLIETQSNVYDLIQYLQSGKMPQLADNTRDIQEEIKYLLSSITNDYENNFYVESYNKGEKSYSDHKYTVSESSIKNLFTLYLDKGYSVKVTNGDIGDKASSSDNYVRWEGIIKVYETSNSDNYAEIHCYKSETTYVEYNQIIGSSSDAKLQEVYSSFFVNLMFADENKEVYAKYIQQFCEQKLASYKKIEYKNEEEKPWKEYCYERLKSFRDGYQACLESLTEMDSQQTIEAIKEIIRNIYNSYSVIKWNITEQMKVLEKQINALYRYLGEYTYETDKYGKRIYSPGYVSEDYTVDYKKEIRSMAYSLPSTKYFIGTKPIACKKCGSSNVGVAKNESGREYNYCMSCGNTESSLLTTYEDIAKQVSDQCQNSSKSLIKEISELRDKFKIENYFGDLYGELLPYIKEQEYSNSNYTSDACNTNQDVYNKAKELLQKAKKELYKACRQQITVSSDIFSIVAERWKNWDVNTKYHDMYDKFTLGNWMRVRLDKTIHKLRLISITFDFDTVDKIPVEFSNVIQVGDVLSDLNSMLQQASSISSTYNYVTDQAKQGSEANVEINKILENGYNSALSAVIAGDNQEITMDRHGLLFRKFLDELDDYSKYQMKLINRNIVMTDDAWETSTLAIGLGMLPDGTYGYGIWADNIIGGNITCTNNMKIIGGKSSVIIDGDGIHFDNGVIDSSAVDGLDDLSTDLDKQKTNLELYEKEIKEFKENVEGCLGTTITKTAVISPKISGGYLYIAKKNGCSVEIDPLGLKNSNVLRIADKNDKGIMTVDSSGNGTFSGKIEADSGNIGGWEINNSSLSTLNNAGIYQANGNSEGLSYAMRILDGKAIFGKYSPSEWYTQNYGYSDISADGIFASTPTYRYFCRIDVENEKIMMQSSEGDINFGCLNGDYKLSSLWIGTKEMRIGREAPSNNRFYIDSQNFNYLWQDANGEDSLIHFINDNNVRFCQYGYGSLQYKGSEVVNVNYGSNNYQPKSSSDLRLKKEIVSLTDIRQIYLAFKPKSYKFKDTKYENNEKIHTGLIAQQVINTLADNGIDWKDTDLVEEYKCRDYMDEGQYTGETAYRINYENLHAYHIAFSQEMCQEIQELKDENKKKDEKISELEKRLEKLESIISSIA